MERYHSLDGLRAAMMLLGLVLHSAANYTVTRSPAWPYQDRSTTMLVDLGLAYIHLFRMPIFFVMAGFFTAFIFYQRGVGAVLRLRGQRVLLPLVLFWIVLFPLTSAGFEFARQGGGLGALAQSAEGFRSLRHFQHPNLMHLWFLYHLLILCAAALLVMPLVQRLRPRLRERVAERFAGLVASPWGPVAFGAVTAITLVPMSYPWIDTSVSLLPPLRILVAYGVFFCFGWLLFVRRDRVSAFAQRFFRHLVLGALATGVMLVLLLKLRSAAPAAVHLLAVAVSSMAIWFQLFGFTGLFVRYLSRPSPAARYLADASYWMYLVHVPLVVWSAGLLVNAPYPALVKLAAVLSITFAGCLLSYHYLVRPTVVGVLLNGRRYPRRPISPEIPIVAPAPVLASEPVKVMNSSVQT